ncbi:MAG TPA: TIGR03013 family XrtA/PEP-CTERM system glycosyltransferase [Caulobacteraceae bacterium]|nr:TIGR03013 family XrtA/PEP-CTERM system glycosyltransferase [Caulobacteraceae bacterium]
MKLFGHYVAPLFLLLAAVDGALFLAVLRLLSLGYHCHACYFGSLVNLRLYQAILLTGVFLLITISVGLYNADALKSFRTFLGRLVTASQLIFIPTVLVVAVTKAAAGMPFGWYIGILSLAILLFMAVQLVCRAVLIQFSRTRLLTKRIVVLGDGKMAAAVTEFLTRAGHTHLKHVQTISNSIVQENYLRTSSNLVLKIRQEEPVTLSVVAQALKADEIVVAVEEKRGLPVHELLECKLKGIEVIDGLTFWEREAGLVDFSNVGAGWLTFSTGFVLDQPRRVLKRILDFVVGVGFLVAVLPLVLVVAAAIKLESPGPVFYRQDRVGLNGKVFRVWKFRSMRSDAEKDGVPRWAGANDDRVTRIGRFIRKVRIDEIPQIINVLAGDMSFIGPRPERPFFVDDLRKHIPYYDLRHRVRPGITGWAQVNYHYGASIEDAKRKFAYDLYYVKKNDLLLDCAILVQTVRVILYAQGGR